MYYGYRIRWAIQQWGRRRRRLGVHWRRSSPTWWKDLVFLLGDLSLLFDVYDIACTACSPRIRPLSAREIEEAKVIFGDSLPYALIRVDQRARIATRRYGIAYVSFLTINAWGPLPPALLLHELIHCWQYVHRGAAYIPRALWAQRTAFGYDYRGVAHLRTLSSLFELNYEQQGDVVADRYRLQRGRQPRWGAATEIDLPVYDRLLEALKKPGPARSDYP